MHISENQPPQNTILTKCSKMTEEGHRRHGMNGNVDRTPKEECHKANYGQGGRLKFFKDGKFILELERAREGERVSWVSVPRKTFWPPPGTASSTPAYRQESSTSLSVSDDNSSIQSSPWQRDHSWKQTTPHKNISKELSLFYWRPKCIRLTRKSRKRRRPHSAVKEEDAARAVKLENNRSGEGKEGRKRRSLLSVVQGLIDKNGRTSTPPRCEVVVSPRKRFLREMEKDSKVQIDDVNLQTQKRSRCKAAQPQSVPQAVSNSVSNSLPVPVTAVKVESPVFNGVEETKPSRNCSYSITSLLAEDHRNTAKRSPSNSPSHFPQHVTHAHYCATPSPAEDRWYSESVDKLRSIELSQAEKCGFAPYPPPQSYLGPPYMYSFPSVPPYYGPGVYGRGYVVPTVYPAPPMAPLPAPMRHEAPSCSWSTDPTRSSHVDGKDDSITDMPLNLSKHSG